MLTDYIIIALLDLLYQKLEIGDVEEWLVEKDLWSDLNFERMVELEAQCFLYIWDFCGII